jgi:lipoteichoic acid synthase
MLFSIMMMPHTPFDYDPYGYREDIFPDFAGRIRRITMKYLNYVDYLDEVIMRFFLNENLEDQTLDNTVYVFYSDHGSGIKNGDLSILLNQRFICN